MGRTITSPSTSNFSPSSTLSLSFLLAGAVLFALCNSHHRKPSSKSQSTSLPSSGASKNSNIPLATDVNAKPSPPPEETQVQEESIKPALLISSQPRRKLSESLRHPEGLPKVWTSTKGEGKQMASQSADDSSVWMKRIILEERCKIPGSDDEDEMVLYDHEGNKQRNYHPRTPRSLPVSRTNSFAIAELKINAS